MVRMQTVTFISLMLLIGTSCKVQRGAKPTNGARLASVSVISTIDGSKVTGRVLNPSQSGQERVAFFFVTPNGREEDITVKDELIVRRDQSTKKFVVSWQGAEIGGAAENGDKLEICGPTYQKNDVCDVTYVQAGKPGEPHLMIIGMRSDYYIESYGVADTGMTAQSSAFQLDRTIDRVDISAPATTEINQGSTATCLYNSTTGIAEWYRNLSLGRNERLSAIDMLARLDQVNGAAVGEVGAAQGLTRLGGVVPDQVLPTQQSYQQYQDFNSVYQFALSKAPTLGSQRTQIPAVQGTTLFMRSQPAKGSSGSPGVTDAEMLKVREWLFTYKRPVHFFAYYGSVWHAIIALGWDDTRGLILIKDSLQESGQKAQWKSIKTYQSVAYGAVGTREAERIENNSGSNNDKPDDEPTKPTQPPTGTPPAGDATVSMALAKESGQWRMYLYSRKYASYMAILGANNYWYYADRFYAEQSSWKTIGSVPVAEGWKDSKTVRVWVRFQDGTVLDKQIPVDDIRN